MYYEWNNAIPRYEFWKELIDGRLLRTPQESSLLRNRAVRRSGLGSFHCVLPRTAESMGELLCRPFGACSISTFHATACAVGCILMPLRGSNGHFSSTPVGELEFSRRFLTRGGLSHLGRCSAGLYFVPPTPPASCITDRNPARYVSNYGKRFTICRSA